MNISDSSACTPDGAAEEASKRSGFRADDPLASPSIGGKRFLPFPQLHRRVLLAIKMKLGNRRGLGFLRGGEGRGFAGRPRESLQWDWT